MKFNLFISKLLLLVALLFVACETPIEPHFTFHPEAPRAGERVTFTNLTQQVVDWNWTFGDGGKSIQKNPTYIYRKPGVYDITLRADSNDLYITTRRITIYDSIPSIYLASDTVNYFQPVTFQTIIYNPFGLATHFQWSFSRNAQGSDLVNGVTTNSTPNVFFAARNVEETVNLRLTVGDSVYQISKKIWVADVKARSLLMAGSDGQIYKQRMFTNGFEAFTSTGIVSGKHTFNLFANENHLYLFDAGTHASSNPSVLDTQPGDGSIRKVNLNNNTSLELVHNRNVSALHGFYNGTVSNGRIYWTDYSDFIYRISDNNQPIGSFQWNGNADAQTTVPYYFLKPDRLGYFGNGLAMGQPNGGIYLYDNVYFWAKGGSGRGIYRFVASDILTANVVSQGTSPRSGVILSDFAIRAFAIDHMNQKIYFSVTAPADKVGFWVANISGTNPIRIDDAPMGNPMLYITGIVVDNPSNRVYWSYIAPENKTAAYFNLHPTHRTGVKFVRLARSIHTDTQIQYFAPGVSVFGLTVDNTPR